MFAQISAVNINAESGNLQCLMAKLAQATKFPFHLYKKECNHGTRLVFPWKPADKDIPMYDLSSDAPDPAQCWVLWYIKVVTQNMTIQCWKQLKTA